jgi:hypothetical protein
VTCANYTYEVFAWLAFAVLTQTLTGDLSRSACAPRPAVLMLLLMLMLAAWFFLVVSTAQIAVWALKKHVAMKQEFAASGKLPKRKVGLGCVSLAVRFVVIVGSSIAHCFWHWPRCMQILFPFIW